MSTLERSENNQIETPLRRFEDSPTFDFYNSLSPIKFVKPIPFIETTNHLNFASLQSVFSSPHTTLKKCRFLPRPQLSDPSRPELSTSDWNTQPDYDHHKENIDPTVPNNHQVSNELHLQQCEEMVAELMGSPDHVPEHASKGNLEEVGSIDQSKIYTSSFNSLVDPATSSYTSIEHIVQNRQPCGDMFFGNSSAQPEEESKMMEINDTLGTNGEYSIQNTCANMDFQISGLYGGVGRPSLVFNNSTSGSLMQQNDSSSVFPGINLHINALAPIPEDYNVVDNHSSLYRTSLINAGPFPSFYRPPTCFNPEILSSILTNFSSKRETVNAENSVPQVEGSYLESGCMENKEINNPSTSKKKRTMSEQAEEGNSSCKRCTCKKSKCLKLYCECFAAGVYCMGPCACINCFNKPVYGDIVRATRKQIKSRNPFAFAPKVIRGPDSLSEIEGDLRTTPASARHKRGCNCKKSGCLKKYCECYQSGVGCSITCRCEGCKNKYGTKDDSGVLSMDHELEEGETNATKRVELNRSLQITKIPDNLQQTAELALTATPSGSGSFPARLVLGNSSFFPPPQRFSHLLGTVEGDKMHEFLLKGPSNECTKLASSPNRKRVSPPKSCLEKSSPGDSSSQKLVLPRFPSLE